MDTTYRLTQTGPEVQQALDQVAPIEAAIAALNEDKVDKEEGKGLSHNNFTDADKQKLADLPTKATLNQELETKQNVIDDLQSIRSGAAAGAQAAPQATTYTKTEVDALTADFITRTVNNLTNYYLKTETYTQAEVQQLIAAVKQFRYQSVAELSTASADTMGIIYLVPSSNPKTQNVKDEFITVSTTNEQQVTTYAWEQIGSTTVDLSGYYTSAQTDAAITAALNTALASYSTTAQMNSVISAALAPYYTKTEIDALLAGKQDVISDLATIRSQAAAAAPQATTYTKTEVDAAIADFITCTVNNLTNYYLKTETYTQAEVQQLIAAVKQFRYQSVAELPTASADTMGIIYLVPSSQPTTQNVKDEFITVSTTNEQQVTTYAWEQIGSTTVDLSGYYTSAQTDAAITASLNTALASYSTTAQMNSAIAAALAPYYTKTEIDALLAGKQDVISDLSTIRSGAASGATAVQPAALTAEETRAKAAEKANADDIDALEALVPSGASALNQLADKQFVNSSVATNTATFRGTYNEVSDLALTTAATRQDIATALAGTIQTADNNDYCFVQIPTSTATPNEIARVERFKFNGSAWAYEYTLNNSGFTAEQWAALNSGIDATDVNKLNALPSKPVSTEASQGLTDIEKTNARDNIGAVAATDNVASATKLQTPRKIYGNNFNGTEDVSGDLSGVGSLAMNGVLSGARGEIKQTVENVAPDYTDISHWSRYRINIDISDNIVELEATGQGATANEYPFATSLGDKLIIFFDWQCVWGAGYVALTSSVADDTIGNMESTSTTKRFAYIVTSNNSNTNNKVDFVLSATGMTAELSNFTIVNLTAMFGAGLEPTTADEFARRLGYASIDDVPYIPYAENPVPLTDAMAVGGDLIIREKIAPLTGPLNIVGSEVALSEGLHIKYDATTNTVTFCDASGTTSKIIYDDSTT